MEVKNTFGTTLLLLFLILNNKVLMNCHARKVKCSSIY